MKRRIIYLRDPNSEWLISNVGSELAIPSIDAKNWFDPNVVGLP